MEETTDHPAYDRDGDGAHDLNTGPLSGKDRKQDYHQTGDDRGYGHDLGSKAEKCPLENGTPEILEAEGLATLFDFSIQSIAQVDHHDNGGLDSCSKEGNVADGDRHAEVVSEEPLQIDPTG